MVRIITDSAADFEPFELEKLNISCIPLKVMLGGTEYEENVNLSKDQFFELLAASESTPKTSQASPYEVEQLLRETRLSVGQGAEECGFCNGNHCGDSFRRWKGVAPTEYRKRCRGETQ